MLLSVVTVCLNRRAGLEATLRSVLGGRPDAAEVEQIVVDGGSTDGSAEVVRAWGDRVARFVSEPDDGIYDAMNKGLRLASGDWVLFLNAGDVLLPGALGSLHLRETDADFLAGRAVVREADGRDRTIVPFGGAEPSHEALFLHPVSHQALFTRREALLRAGGYDRSYRILADWAFALRATRAGARWRVTDAVVARVEPGGVSATAVREVLDERLRLAVDAFGPELGPRLWAGVRACPPGAFPDDPARRDDLVRWNHLYHFLARHGATRWIPRAAAALLRRRERRALRRRPR